MAPSTAIPNNRPARISQGQPLLAYERLKEAAATRAAEIARALIGYENAAVSSKRELRFGRKGSLAVVVAGQKSGVWYDYEVGEGGDLFDLIRRERKVGFKEALAIARQLVSYAADVQLMPPIPNRKQAIDREQRHQGARDAHRLWAETVDLRGTLGERYLTSRGIVVLPRDIGEVLRFHPRGRFGPTRSPMLVALYRDIQTNEPRGVHRTALSPNGEKIERKCLGPKAGAAIKLTADEEVTQGLTIGEGVETTLSAMMLGLTPAWALGDAGAIGTFPVLAGIDGLTILVDHDASGTGQKQAAKCRDRWLAAGREVLTVQPDQVGYDVNDLLGARK